MSLDLRRYQSAAIQAIYDYFGDKTGNPLVVIPTAGGKSLVMSDFTKGVLAIDPKHRILVVTHQRELIQQDFDELKKVWPEAPAGIYSAGLKQRDIDAPILFASIQSIYKRVAEVGTCDLVLIDEAHLIPRSSNTRYGKFLRELRQRNPDMKVIGFTATPYRLDSGSLCEGADAIFTDIAYEVSVHELINDGYLSRLVSKHTATQLDVSKVGSAGGEFIARDLEAAVDQASINLAAVREIIRFGEGRKSLLVFCAGVDHAHHIRDAIRAQGVTCETIVGTTPSADRDRFIDDFKAGRVRCLTNANVLTTGFNAPQVDLVAMLRPTQSQGLYVQMVGRGCRLARGKGDCLVLDFAGNIARHGPIDAIKPKRPGGGQDGAAPTKVCPECSSIVHASVRECPDCGHAFPPPQVAISAHASELEVLSSGKSEWVPVTDVKYSRHHKPGKTPSLRVDYSSGLIHHSEWVCFEHQGAARQIATEWWAKRAPGLPPPRRVDDAIACVSKLRKPSAIAVRPNGKYTQVVAARFA